MPFDSIGDLLPLLILLIPVIQWLRQLASGNKERAEAVPAPQPRPPSLPVPAPARAQTPAPLRAADPAAARPPAPRLKTALPPRAADALASSDTAAPRRPPAAPPAAAPRALRVNYAAALRNRSTARHAMVLMTILGPCRAMQPFQAQEPQ